MGHSACFKYFDCYTVFLHHHIIMSSNALALFLLQDHKLLGMSIILCQTNTLYVILCILCYDYPCSHMLMHLVTCMLSMEVG